MLSILKKKILQRLESLLILISLNVLIWTIPSFASELTLSDKASILSQFLSKELVGKEQIYQVVPNDWLTSNEKVKDAKIKIQQELVQLKDQAKIEPKEIEFRTLQLQLLELSLDDRKNLIENARAKQLAEESGKQAELDAYEAEKERKEHEAKEAELTKAIELSKETRKTQLLELRKKLEEEFTYLSEERAKLANAQKNLTTRLEQWWKERDEISERMGQFSAEERAAGKSVTAWNDAMNIIAARIRRSNSVILTKNKLWVDILPKNLKRKPIFDIDVQVFEKDSQEVKDLIRELRSKAVELQSEAAAFEYEKRVLFLKTIEFQRTYRKSLKDVRAEILLTEDGKKWRNAYKKSDRSPFKNIRTDLMTLWSEVRFLSWRVREVEVSTLQPTLSWDEKLWTGVKQVFNWIQAFLVVLLALFVIRQKRRVMGRVRTWFASTNFSTTMKRYVHWTIELLNDFYVFLALGLIGKISIDLAVGSGFSGAALFYPYLKLLLIYFLGRGFLEAIGPIISQRKAKTWGTAQGEVLAIESTFRLIPFYVLAYWTIWKIVETALRQILGISVLEKWFDLLGWYLFPFLLLLGVWLNRKDWRMTCRTVSASEKWKNILDKSEDKFWEPVVLLLGGGLGVYLIAWRRIGTRIAEAEFTKSFQAMVSRALLERSKRRRIVRLNFDSLPQGYADTFGNRNLWKPEWHVSVNQAEEAVNKAFEAWEKEKEGNTVILIGDRGIGKSAILHSFLNKKESNICKAYLTQEANHPKKALCELSQQLLGQNIDDEFTIAKKLNELEPSILVLENLENCILRKVGGYHAYEAILNVMASTAPHHLWVTTMISQTWGFAHQSFNGADCFSHCIYVNGMNEEQVSDMVIKRHQSSGLPLDFSEISFSEKRTRRWNKKADEEERRRKLFFRILWDYTDGNPKEALYFWGTSVQVSGQKAKITLFEIPESSILSALSDPVLMLLAALIEHNGLPMLEACEVLNESKENILRLLEVLSPHGIVYRGKEEGGEVLHIESFWYRAVKDYLTRRNLLFKGWS